jgi:hypothetical protein
VTVITDAGEDFLDDRDESKMIDGFGETYVSEVSWTVFSFAPTSLTPVVFELRAHTRIVDGVVYRFSSVKVFAVYLVNALLVDDGVSYNFVRIKYGNFDFLNLATLGNRELERFT